MGEIVANSLRGRRAAHPNFGRRRCEHILALQNFCVELLARATPKTHTSNVEHAQDFAKIWVLGSYSYFDVTVTEFDGKKAFKPVIVTSKLL